MKIGFSFTGNEALEFHDEINSKQGKLEGAYNQMICNWAIVLVDFRYWPSETA